jgi:hypothetical protein
MKFIFKFNTILLLFIIACNYIHAQTIQKEFYRDSIKNNLNLFSNKKFSKQLDNKAIEIALQYYSELSNTHIHFRVRKRKSPFSSRPSFSNIFKKKQHHVFIITISNKSTNQLENILFKNLSFNAQIGVIGHELSHIAHFQSMSFLKYCTKSLNSVHKKNVDKSEYETDLKTIDHGLGFQLLSWSKEVRTKLNIQQRGGSSNPQSSVERYMNPTSIINAIQHSEKYKYFLIKNN